MLVVEVKEGGVVVVASSGCFMVVTVTKRLSGNMAIVPHSGQKPFNQYPRPQSEWYVPRDVFVEQNPNVVRWIIIFETMALEVTKALPSKSIVNPDARCSHLQVSSRFLWSFCQDSRRWSLR